MFFQQGWETDENLGGSVGKERETDGRRGIYNSQNRANHSCQPVSALLPISLCRALSTSRGQPPASTSHVSNDGQVLHEEGHAALGRSPVGDNAR